MCPSEVYCLWLYPKDVVPSLDQFSFRVERTRSRGKGDSWCFCLVAIVIDLILMVLMTIIYYYCQTSGILHDHDDEVELHVLGCRLTY